MRHYTKCASSDKFHFPDYTQNKRAIKPRFCCRNEGFLVGYAMNIRKRPIYYITSGFVAGILISIGVYTTAEADNSSVTTTTTTKQNKTLPLDEVQRFTTAISEIKSYYVKPVTDEQLFEYAIKGMVDSLDPHSNYLNADDYKDLTSTTSGEFGGLGLEVTQYQGVIKVISPLDGTPAYNAGIKAGDLIISLDSTPTDGMSLKDAVDKMRGKVGSVINLVVIRDGQTKPLTFNIMRDQIHVKSVKVKMLGDGYGYIRLAQFQENSANEMSDAIKSLEAQAKILPGGKLKGLILDLRNNPGGLLDSAVAISDMFLDGNKLGANKLIVYTKGRVPDAQMSENALPNGDLLNGIPMVVLIDGGTASAAEIVAGALQDHKRAILVGSKSFGKGSVQTVLPLDNTTGIKITTALYFTPLGRSIQALGIQPDIKIDNLAVSKTAAANNTLDYSEANLTGHLDNGQGIKTDGIKNITDTNQNLAHDDYVLYEGLNVLKSMTVIENKGQQN